MTDQIKTINRRTFISKVGVVTVMALGSVTSIAKPVSAVYWAGTAKHLDVYWLIMFDDLGQIVRKIELPSRGHGIQQSAQGHLIVCGRRPGTWMLLLQSCHAAPQWIKGLKKRSLSGHCCFSGDGHLFYTAENDFELGQGVIGVWDRRTGKRLWEWSSQGIGPHEILLSHDGSHLWVANGGILTHPDQTREKLNLDTMLPNVSYLCLADGELKQQYSVDESMLSLRHLAVNQKNQVAVACQYQGPDYQRKNLLLLISEGQINELPCDPKVTTKLKNYLGSVTFDASGEWISATSPKGHQVVIWRLSQNLQPVHYHTLHITDACGVSATSQAGGFVISTGMGQVMHYLAPVKKLTSYPSAADSLCWDNHLTVLQS